MGWSESPAYFCAATETARDVAHTALQTNAPTTPHPMEDIVLNRPWPPQSNNTSNKSPLITCTMVEVYIDDFIVATQETDRTRIQQITRHVLHAIDAVFPGPELTGSTMEPAISKKKLLE